MKKYRKWVVTAVGVVLSGLNLLYGHNQAVQLLIMVAVSAGVYTVPNHVDPVV